MQHSLYQRLRVASAARIEPANLSQWIKRGYPVLSEGRGDVAGDGPGVHHLFSEDTVIQVAIAARLVERGFPVEDALLAALGYFVAHDGREPGKPFPAGDTLLFAAGDTSWIVNAHSKGSADAIGLFLGDAGVFGEAFELGRTAVTVLNVGALHRDVCERLHTPTRRTIGE